MLFGTVTEGDEEGLYLFETESVNEEAVLASQPFDIAAVKAFVFATDIVGQYGSRNVLAFDDHRDGDD